MPETLKECLDELLRKGVIVLGIGVETERLGDFFKLHASIYTKRTSSKSLGQFMLTLRKKRLKPNHKMIFSRNCSSSVNVRYFFGHLCERELQIQILKSKLFYL